VVDRQPETGSAVEVVQVHLKREEEVVAVSKWRGRRVFQQAGASVAGAATKRPSAIWPLACSRGGPDKAAGAIVPGSCSSTSKSHVAPTAVAVQAGHSKVACYNGRKHGVMRVQEGEAEAGRWQAAAGAQQQAAAWRCAGGILPGSPAGSQWQWSGNEE